MWSGQIRAQSLPRHQFKSIQCLLEAKSLGCHKVTLQHPCFPDFPKSYLLFLSFGRHLPCHSLTCPLQPLLIWKTAFWKPFQVLGRGCGSVTHPQGPPAEVLPVWARHHRWMEGALVAFGQFLQAHIHVRSHWDGQDSWSHAGSLGCFPTQGQAVLLCINKWLQPRGSLQH